MSSGQPDFDTLLRDLIVYLSRDVVDVFVSPYPVNVTGLLSYLLTVCRDHVEVGLTPPLQDAVKMLSFWKNRPDAPMVKFGSVGSINRFASTGLYEGVLKPAGSDAGSIVPTSTTSTPATTPPAALQTISPSKPPPTAAAAALKTPSPPQAPPAAAAAALKTPSPPQAPQAPSTISAFKTPSPRHPAGTALQTRSPLKPAATPAAAAAAAASQAPPTGTGLLVNAGLGSGSGNGSTGLILSQGSQGSRGGAAATAPQAASAAPPSGAAATAASQAPPAETAAQPPAGPYDKYAKMLRMGLDVGAVRQKIANDKLNPNEVLAAIQAPSSGTAASPSGAAAQAAQQPPPAAGAAAQAASQAASAAGAASPSGAAVPPARSASLLSSLQRGSNEPPNLRPVRQQPRPGASQAARSGAAAQAPPSGAASQAPPAAAPSGAASQAPPAAAPSGAAVPPARPASFLSSLEQGRASLRPAAQQRAGAPGVVPTPGGAPGEGVGGPGVVPGDSSLIGALTRGLGQIRGAVVGSEHKSSEASGWSEISGGRLSVGGISRRTDEYSHDGRSLANFLSSVNRNMGRLQRGHSYGNGSSKGNSNYGSSKVFSTRYGRY